MFSETIVEEIVTIAQRLNVPPATLLAVAEVESGGRTEAQVGERLEPLIRFEGHYFDRLLPAAKRRQARKMGLASPKAGRVRNPRGQAARWHLLHRAVALDRVAAYSSVSWGLGQVMGAHWAWLGYGSIDALVVVARSGVAGQVDLMARYIERAGLCEALRGGDFRTFARRYNGPAFAKNRYHTRMAAACRRWEARLERGLPEATRAGDTARSLQFGARGDDVRALQRALAQNGHYLVADGLFGIRTDRALRRFQRDRGFVETGVVGFVEAHALLGADAALRFAAQKAASALRAVVASCDAKIDRLRQAALSILRSLA